MTGVDYSNIITPKIRRQQICVESKPVYSSIMYFSEIIKTTGWCKDLLQWYQKLRGHTDSLVSSHSVLEIKLAIRHQGEQIYKKMQPLNYFLCKK